MIKRFSSHSGVKAMRHIWNDENVRTVHLKGLSASATPMFFAALAASDKPWQVPAVLFVLNDLEEAGYFYHDLTQALGDRQVLFLPSSYKRAIKYGQKDSANEVLRTEVLTRLIEASKLTIDNSQLTIGSAKRQIEAASMGENNCQLSIVNCPLYIVSYPDALAELVVSQATLTDRSVQLAVGDTVEIPQMEGRSCLLRTHWMISSLLFY